MKTNSESEAIILCEKALDNIFAENAEMNILAKSNDIITRMLNQRVLLAEVYEEICEKLGESLGTIQAFFEICLRTARLYNQSEVSNSKAEYKSLQTINSEIAKEADKLKALLAEREQLENSSGHSCGAHYHIADLVCAAAKTNGKDHFLNKAEIVLEDLADVCEFKYWPTLEEIIGEIGKNAAAVKTYTRDKNLRAETVGQRYSKTLFWKALHNEIDEGKKAYINRIPPSFNMTNQALATLTNCLLELREDEWATAATVNSFKGNLRNSMKVNE